MLDAETKSKIDAELIRVYFRNGATGAAFPVVLFVLILAVSWNEIPHAALLPWLLTTLMTNVARLLVARRFIKIPRTDIEAHTWAKAHTILQFVNALALAWGVFVFFIWGDSSYQTFYTLILFALIVGGSLTIAPYRPATIFVAPPVLLTLAGWHAARGDAISLVLGACLLLLLLFVILVSRNTRNLLKTTLELRLEKEGLADQLAGALKNKNLFLARASHDLRQPLHAMTLFNAAAEAKAQDRVQMPTQDRSADYTILNLVQRTGRSISALSTLVNSLLDVSKLDTDDLTPDLSEFPINQILADIHHDLSGEASQNGIDLHLVPSSAVVRSDPVMLSRILRNLVSNAVRYTVKGRVLIGCRIRGDELSVEIWDTGIGIPKDEQQNVFKEFTRLESARRFKQEGIGLGLSIVKRMANLLGHRLTLRSEVDKGTVFALRIARIGWSVKPTVTTEPIQEQARSAQTAQGEPSAKPDPSATRIAIIDNDPEALWAMTALLAEWGCVPIVGVDSIGTAKALRDASTIPDLILADYELDDGRTGAEAIKDLRAEFGADIPAVLITGRVTPLRKSDADALNVTIFTKPLRTSHLHAFVNKIV